MQQQKDHDAAWIESLRTDPNRPSVLSPLYTVKPPPSPPAPPYIDAQMYDPINDTLRKISDWRWKGSMRADGRYWEDPETKEKRAEPEDTFFGPEYMLEKQLREMAKSADLVHSFAVLVGSRTGATGNRREYWQGVGAGSRAVELLFPNIFQDKIGGGKLELSQKQRIDLTSFPKVNDRKRVVEALGLKYGSDDAKKLAAALSFSEGLKDLGIQGAAGLGIHIPGAVSAPPVPRQSIDPPVRAFVHVAGDPLPTEAPFFNVITDRARLDDKYGHTTERPPDAYLEEFVDEASRRRTTVDRAGFVRQWAEEYADAQRRRVEAAKKAREDRAAAAPPPSAAAAVPPAPAAAGAPEETSVLVDGVFYDAVDDPKLALFRLMNDKKLNESRLKAWDVLYQGGKYFVKPQKGEGGGGIDWENPVEVRKAVEAHAAIVKILNRGEGSLEWHEAPENSGLLHTTDQFRGSVKAAHEFIKNVCHHPEVPVIDLMMHDNVRSQFADVVANFINRVQYRLGMSRNLTSTGGQELKTELKRLKALFRTLFYNADGYLCFESTYIRSAELQRRDLEATRALEYERTGQFHSDVGIATRPGLGKREKSYATSKPYTGDNAYHQKLRARAEEMDSIL